MRFQFYDGDKPIDAQMWLEKKTEVTVFAGWGAKGSPAAQNSEYSRGLLCLVSSLQASKIPVEGAWVWSREVKKLDPAARHVWDPARADDPAESVVALLTSRMRALGQASGTKGRSPTRGLRFKLGKPITHTALGARPVNLPHSVLSKVTKEHIRAAATSLLSGAKHPFGKSVDYDVVVDQQGSRLPPKAVFGLAASSALGFQVTPYHFKAGENSPCFQALLDAGFDIVPKGATARVPYADQDWQEGSETSRAHLRKERAPGLARKKKKAFLKEHGKLFCQRCTSDLAHIGPDAARDSAFEVHHAKTAVADMKPGHRTKLEDLMCLCAVCHRIVHWELRQQTRDSESTGSPNAVAPA